MDRQLHVKLLVESLLTDEPRGRFAGDQGIGGELAGETEVGID